MEISAVMKRQLEEKINELYQEFIDINQEGLDDRIAANACFLKRLDVLRDMVNKPEEFLQIGEMIISEYLKTPESLPNCPIIVSPDRKVYTFTEGGRFRFIGRLTGS